MTFWQWFWTTLAVYLVFMQIFAVIITISDKRRAKKDKERIREKTLFLVSWLGGSIAMYITMLKIRHKTQHKKFMIGIPLIILVQILVVVGIIVLCNVL